MSAPHGLGGAVELAVDTRIAQDGLHVFAGFGKGDGLDKFLGIAVMTLSQPVSDTVGAGIVGGQRIFELSVVLVDHIFEIARAEFEVHGRGVELGRAVAFELHLFRYTFSRLRQKLHQADGIGAGERSGIEFGLLPDERCDEIGIEAIEHRIFTQIGPIRFGKKRFPVGARQVGKIAGFTDLRRGITVNPGLISGGTRVNVVAAEARAEVDMRVPRLKDAAALDRKFHALRPLDKRCTIQVSGGLNRPPLERSPAIAQLFRKARKLACDMGVALDESSVGGGSDGNFTAALGVPTLDGLGAVGEGAHALNESILMDRIADRTALLAKLVMAL